MNVNEQVLQEKIDPLLTKNNLETVCTKVLAKNVSIKNAYILTGGCLNRLVGLDFKGDQQPLVLKVTPNVADIGLRHEFSVLKYLCEHTQMPVPEPLYLDDSGDDLPGTFFIMKKMAGTVMHQAALSQQDKADVLEQIATFVVELHKEKSEGFGPVTKEQSCSNWSEFWLPRFDKALDTIREGGHVAGSMMERVAEIRPRLTQLLDIGTEGTLTHYDIWAGNIMLDIQYGKPKVTGFLDVQGYWADYARELSFMEMFGLADQTVYKTYTDHYPLDQNFQIRKNLYNLKMHMKHIHMYPAQSFYRIGAENCLQIVEKALGK